MPAAATGPSDLPTVTIADLSTTIGDEPRIRDCVLAERLGFEQPRQIRELIERNLEEIKSYGSLSCRTTNPSSQGGRPGKEYLLNEGQALCVCALSRAPRAPQVRRGLIEAFMIEAFMELRRGRRLPKPPPPPAVTHGTVTCDGQVLAFDPTVPVRTLAHGTRVVAVHWDGRIAVETLLVDTTYNRRCGGMSGTGWELYLSRAGFARDPRADPDAADPPVVRVLVLGPVVAAPA